MKKKLHQLTIKLRLTFLNFEFWIQHALQKSFAPYMIAIYLGIISSVIILSVSSSKYIFAIPKDPSIFYTAAGLVGGALAIIVTLNTLMLQNALEKLPARTYAKFTNHNGLNVIYLILSIITIALFGLGVSYIDQSNNPRSFTLRIALALICWALVFIFIYLRVVIDTVNPFRQVIRLANVIKKKIDLTEKFVKKYHSIFKDNKNELNDSVIQSGIRQKLNPRMDDVLTDLDDISGQYSRYLQRGDQHLALASLQIIFRTVVYIYDKRKNTAVALPTEYIFSPKSDLSDISLKVDEIILPIWKDALLRSDVKVIREMLLGYQSMVIAAASIKHQIAKQDNPLLPYTLGGLSTIINLGIEKLNVDAMFHSAQVLQKVAIHIYKECQTDLRSHSQFELCWKLILNLYAHATIKRLTSVMKVCLEASLYILSTAVLVDNKQVRFKTITKERFAEVLTVANNKVNQQNLIAGDEIIIQEQLIQHVFGTIPKKPKKSDLVNLINRTSIVIQSLENFTENSKFVLSISFERFFELTGQVLLDLYSVFKNELSDRENRKAQELFESLRSIQTNTIHNYDYDKRHSGEAISYTEKLSIIGMDAITFNNDDEAIAIVKNLMASASDLLKLSGKVQNIDNDALRVVRYAGFVAATAYKNGKPHILDAYIQLLHEFEKSWLSLIFPKGFDADKSYVPSPNSIRYLFENIIDNGYVSGLPDYFESAQDKILKAITSDELEDFQNKLWDNTTPPQPKA